MMDATKYSVGYYPPPVEPGHVYEWPQKDHIEQAPAWCSVDLRLPLELPKEDPCKFCAFSNICGNSELCRQRIPYGDSRMQEKKMMEILEELAEEENN